MALRILASLILLFSILFLPFWLSIILLLANMAYFSIFLEGIFIFLISDLLYGVERARFSGEVFVALTLSLVFLFVIELLKKRLKFYPSRP